MKIVIHRVNRIDQLPALPTHYGAEIDLRCRGSDLILHHDPHMGGDRFVDYLGEYRHGLLILNIKEAGIEDEALKLVRQAGIADFFLLDVEFPYLIRAACAGEKKIAIRYSEWESIDTVRRFSGLLDWVWIDTITRLPLDAPTIRLLHPFRTCLVCPERWGRAADIAAYRKALSDLDYSPEAVMTSLACAPQWTQADDRTTRRSFAP